MTINNKINRDHDTSWLKSNKKQDVPDSTHKLVSVNNTFKMMKIHPKGLAIAEIKNMFDIDLFAFDETSEHENLQHRRFVDINSKFKIASVLFADVECIVVKLLLYEYGDDGQPVFDALSSESVVDALKSVYTFDPAELKRELIKRMCGGTQMFHYDPAEPRKLFYFVPTFVSFCV